MRIAVLIALSVLYAYLLGHLDVSTGRPARPSIPFVLFLSLFTWPLAAVTLAITLGWFLG